MTTDTIDTVLFDLDGVLVDMRPVHRRCLNQALDENGVKPIHPTDEWRFEGLPTARKLEMLGLEGETARRVAERKRDLTMEAAKDLKPDPRLQELFRTLAVEGVSLGVVSNARSEFVWACLERVLGDETRELIGRVFTPDLNPGVPPKPSPDLYRTAMAELCSDPLKTFVFEDSPVGRRAARASGARLIPVFDMADVCRQSIEAAVLGSVGITKVVPMAGRGQRFADAGYRDPKPLIQTEGKTILQHAVDSSGFPEARLVLLYLHEHFWCYQREAEAKLAGILGRVLPAQQTAAWPLYSVTDGTASTVLESETHVWRDGRLVVANSDQLLVGTDMDLFVETVDARGFDAGILTFTDTEFELGGRSKWSYVERTGDGTVTRVTEKTKTSDHTICGVFYVRHARDLYDAIRAMKTDERNRVNGEWYLAPAFNSMVAAGKRVLSFDVPPMVGLGTPEDLRKFEES